MKITLIAAMDPNKTIGKNNDLPRGRAYPEDLQRFKKVTSGHTIVM
jgi:dihydrofolate reductase